MVAGCKFYVCGEFFRARWPFIEKDKENDFIFPLKMRTTGFKKLCVGPFSIEIGGNLKRKEEKRCVGADLSSEKVCYRIKNAVWYIFGCMVAEIASMLALDPSATVGGKGHRR